MFIFTYLLHLGRYSPCSFLVGNWPGFPPLLSPPLVRSVLPSCLLEHILLVILPFTVQQLLSLSQIIPISLQIVCNFFHLQTPQNKQKPPLIPFSLTPTALSLPSQKNSLKSYVKLTPILPLRSQSGFYPHLFTERDLVEVSDDLHTAKSDGHSKSLSYLTQQHLTM